MDKIKNFFYGLMWILPSCILIALGVYLCISFPPVLLIFSMNESFPKAYFVPGLIIWIYLIVTLLCNIGSYMRGNNASF